MYAPNNASPAKNASISCYQFEDRCFATAGPTVEQSAGTALAMRHITFGQFKRSWKTFVWLAGPRRPVSEH